MSNSQAFYSWKAGAKVGDIAIQSKYIQLFFERLFELFYNWLIDKDVIEHSFKGKPAKDKKRLIIIYTREAEPEKRKQ